jgi:hypothetical protein
MICEGQSFLKFYFSEFNHITSCSTRTLTQPNSSSSTIYLTLSLGRGNAVAALTDELIRVRDLRNSSQPLFHAESRFGLRDSGSTTIAKFYLENKWICEDSAAKVIKLRTSIFNRSNSLSFTIHTNAFHLRVK